MSSNGIEAGKTSAETEQPVSPFITETVDEVLACLREKLQSMGLSATDLAGIEPTIVQSKDPFDGVVNHTFSYRKKGEYLCSVQVRTDGVVSAELLTSAVHPKRRHLFVEAVEAWGKRGSVHTDLRVGPLSEELRTFLEASGE